MDHRPIWMIVLAAWLMLASSSCARAPQRAEAPAAKALHTRIDAVFADVTGRRPGYAIAIVDDGRLSFARGYGRADIETGAPITADTAFDLASLSKQFTAAAVAHEIAAGRMTLDDRLRAHWPDLPPFLEPVTVGHLVYMTSGVPEYYSLPSPRGGWASENAFTVDDAIGAVLRNGRLTFEPGTRWSYSNINYQLLARTVARLNGTDFATHMTRRFFLPLGMRRTWVDARLEQRPPMARSYVPAAVGAGWRVAPRRSPHYGGSGMFSTLEDLARWDAALYRDKALGEAFTRIMLSTRRYAHPKDNDAFGLVHGTRNGQATVWYEGGDYGVSTFMIRVPARRLTVICLANFAEANCAARANRVLDIALAQSGR